MYWSFFIILALKVHAAKVSRIKITNPLYFDHKKRFNPLAYRYINASKRSK
jgi:hypothetical protein